MDNYSPLQRNTLAGLSDISGLLYLQLCDKYEAHKSQDRERRAFLDACECEEKMGEVISHIIYEYPGFETVSEEVKHDLCSFFMKRWLNNFMEKRK